MNNCIFLARLVRDPELRYLPNGGTGIANFTVAVDKGLSKDKKEEFKAQNKPVADFLNMVAWNKLGETIANHFKKGDLILLQASAQSGKYEDKDGKTVYTTDFRVNGFDFVGGNNGGSGNSSTGNSSSDFTGDGFDPVNEDDIPF